MTHVGGMALAGLVYVTATNYCQTNDNCKPQIPIIYYGMGYSELAEYILDEQMGNGSNGKPTSALLRRQLPANDRKWLNDKNIVDTNICPVPRGTTAKQCDEYPFNSSKQGGEHRYIAGGVSIRMINTQNNRNGGSNLGAMYKRDGTKDNDEFLVLADPSSPLSFYITRQGKFQLF